MGAEGASMHAPIMPIALIIWSTTKRDMMLYAIAMWNKQILVHVGDKSWCISDTG